MIKVRFNLGKGKNYKKWQVKRGTKVEYFDPDVCQLKMFDCKLRNQPKTATKIFQGRNKTVCAWIDCSTIEISQTTQEVENNSRIHYNPKVAPFWQNEQGLNVDNAHFDFLISRGRVIFVKDSYENYISNTCTIN